MSNNELDQREPPPYTIDQVWQILGGPEIISRQAVYDAAGRDFDVIRIGRRILINRRLFHQFLLGTRAKNESAA